MGATFEIWRDAGKQWRWRLRHDNGKVIAHSDEGYTTKENAVHGIHSVKQNCPLAPLRELRPNASGQRPEFPENAFPEAPERDATLEASQASGPLPVSQEAGNDSPGPTDPDGHAPAPPDA